MKLFLFVLTLFFSIPAFAQFNPDLAGTANPVEMLFPGGKSKALILSYDDSPQYDRRLVQLMNTYGLVGTFHLNSNKLDTKDYLSREEIKTLFAGHEVSVHTANHPNLIALSKADVVYEVVEDRRALEKLVGYPVRGMAYPFGNTNEAVVDAIKGLGIEYARTVDDTYEFGIPTDFLRWNPTVHQFAKAYFVPDQPETDKAELAKFYQTISRFLDTKKLAILDIWGHSWEMGADEGKWKETEKFFKMVAKNPGIFYTTHIGLVDYIYAYRSLLFSVDKSIVTNQSAIDVYFRYNGKDYTVKGGTTLTLGNK